jgi:hypothetical protein
VSTDTPASAASTLRRSVCSPTIPCFRVSLARMDKYRAGPFRSYRSSQLKIRA